MKWLDHAFLVSGVSFGVSAIGAALMSRFGRRFSFLDSPNERSSHAFPTPRGGGIGIWVSFIITGVLVLTNTGLTLALAAIGLLGLLEDRLNLSSQLRLVIQVFLSFTAVVLIIGPPASVGEMVTCMFWILFITGTANFYNFMDGIDGIAGMTGVICFGFLAVFSVLFAGDPEIALMSLGLASGCLGFLPFNFPRARVFMGDVGSVFLGFAFAVFAVKLSTTVSVFLCVAMFLCTFYADALVTIFYRWKNGEDLMKAHRSHLYQYLSNELRISHWKVTVAFAVIQSVFGALSLVSYKAAMSWQITVFGMFGITFVIAYKFIKGNRQVTERQRGE